MSGRCRLCTANDRKALAEKLACEMWESRRERGMDPAWADCGSYWQGIFRGFAATTLGMLERGHA